MIKKLKAKTDRIYVAPVGNSARKHQSMCARAAPAPSCNGFTIGQLCEIVDACPPSRASASSISPFSRRISYPQHIHDLETLEFEALTTTCCARIHRLHERAHRPLR
jgi:hypothetical protein